MKRFLLIIFTVSVLAACSKNDDPVPGENDHTVFMYMPWATNLLTEFNKNIADFESAVAKGILKNERVIVFLSTTTTEAIMFELKYSKGKCIREDIKTYTDPPFTTAAGITSILKDVIRTAPANRYSLIVGCHGMGWIPVAAGRSRSLTEKEYWEYEGVPRTRWFGGLSAPYQTDITTLAEGINGAGIKMEYILFDDCFMSSIEAAYDLRHVAGHIIGCPTEIMAHGMPYAEMAAHLIGKVDYEKITDVFLEFYSNYSLMPCGTIGVTVCSELEGLAAVMRTINRSYTFDTSNLSDIQTMDGYYPNRFYDLGSYVNLLCDDTDLLAQFEAQLERAVPSKYRKHTTHYYTMIGGGRRILIETYSGTTTSDPSTSSSTSLKTETAWYAATH